MMRIEKGGDTVIVSTLVIMEIIEVIRKRIAEKENYIGLTEPVKQQIKTKIDIKTKEFMEKITKLAAQGKVMLIDPDKPLKGYLTDTISVFSPHFGDIEKFDYCFTCNRNTTVRYRYRGLGHYDIQHAINAKDCLANEIFSFDKGFHHLNHIPEFSSLKVNVI